MKKILFKSFFTFLLIFSGNLFAQRNISGTVKDSDGLPLPGATVVVLETNQGTTTDFEGNFSINVQEGQSITVAFIGYVSQTVRIGNSSSYDIVLEEDNLALDEVVVTSLGISREKRTLSYSVTQVGGDKFVESRTSNLGNALSGKVAGVNIQAPTTGAAGSSRVTIRGGSSLGGNDQPLYVVNGIPIETGTFGQAGMWGGNDAGDGLTAINPDDIESISVLKGNTASALYGSRAANGVIIITTKSGVARKGLEVTLNSNYTVDQVIDRTNFQRVYGAGIDGKKFTNENDAFVNSLSHWGEKFDGSSVVQFDGVSRPYTNLGYTLKDFYNQGSTLTNTVSLSGGNESGNFRFSASDLENQDIVPNAALKRNTFNLAVSGKQDRLSFDASVNYSVQRTDNRPRVSDLPNNFNFIAGHPASIPLDVVKGPYGTGSKEDGYELNYFGNIFLTNPYFSAYRSIRGDNTDRILGSLSLKYDLTDWAYVLARAGTDNAFREESSLAAAYGTAFAPKGQYFEDFTSIVQNNYELILGGNKSFGKVDLDYLVGVSSWRKEYEKKGVYGLELVVPFFESINNIASANKTYDFFETGQNSIFGNLNIGFDNWLYLNFSAREDQFSTLSPDNNSSVYPSAGASIILSEKLDLPSLFSFVKLRGSWAQVGGGGPNPYATIQTYSLLEQHGSANTGDFSSFNISNPFLSPYTSTEIEFGTNLRLFDNKLEIDAAIYNRNTTNDILSTQISGTSGWTGTTVNVGELENKGFELLVNWNVISKGDFRWNTSFNYAHNKSKALNLGTDASGNPIEKLTFGNSRLMIDSVNHLLGEPLGVIMGYKHLTSPDGQKYYDANGDPVRTPTYETLGLSIHPKVGGISNTFSYKNWSLYSLIDFRMGGSIFAGSNRNWYRYGLHEDTLQGRNGEYTVSGLLYANGAPTTTPVNQAIPAERIDNYWFAYGQLTENLIYDASFGKLRELSLKYTFPREILENTFMDSASLSAVGRNLLLLWSHTQNGNVDPESAFSGARGFQGLEYNSVPLTTNIGINLNVKF